MLRRLTGALAIFALMPTVFAHEGHGHPDHPQGILHYVCLLYTSDAADE